MQKRSIHNLIINECETGLHNLLPGQTYTKQGTQRQEICAMADDELQKITQQRKNADTYSIAEQWEETVAKKQDKVCFHYLGDPENNFPPRALSFNDVDGIANQVANWAWKQGLQKGDTVALFLRIVQSLLRCGLALQSLGSLQHGLTIQSN